MAKAYYLIGVDHVRGEEEQRIDHIGGQKWHRRDEQ